jgi:diacylglycerol kinase (ATP)
VPSVTSRLLIVNPAARGGRSAEAQAVAACTATGIAVRVVRTTAPGHAAEIARAETDGAPILVLGGDGTVMEVVGALVGRDVPVGILPGGTGNQLARHLRIPLHVGRAAHALATARPLRYDLGRLSDGRYFALAAGIGVDAAMIAGASTAAKRRYGVGAYIWSATRALIAARPFAVRIVADGKVFEREAGLAMIANVGSVMDGRFSLGPGVSPTDGWLDLCVLSPRGIGDGLALAARMATGNFRDDPRMLFYRAKSIRIEAAADVGAEADGELLAAPILDATVVPGGATFLAVH